MDSRQVPPEYMSAGQEYFDALVQLGLIPAFLGWGWNRAAQEWLLVLVTSILEAGGPLKLNQLLFKAYNAKATPKQIPVGARSDFWLLGEKNFTVQGVPGKVRDLRALEPKPLIERWLAIIAAIKTGKSLSESRETCGMIKKIALFRAKNGCRTFGGSHGR